MKVSEKEATSRFVKACQQFDKENATSAMNLNSVVSLWEDAQNTVHPEKDEILEKYRHIPESVIRSIKGLLQHNRSLADILFHGKGEDTKSLEQYCQDKEDFFKELRDIVRKSNES